MQIIGGAIKDGKVELQIENLNDLWDLYNLIKPGDSLSGKTSRRIVLTPGTPGDRKWIWLQIDVEKLEFHEFANRLRISGKIQEGPDDYVSIGQYHTFNVEPNSRITVEKENWLKSEIKRLKGIQKQYNSRMVIAIGIEKGNAVITLLTNYSINPITEITKNIPGKRYDKQNQKKALEKFYKNLHLALQSSLDKHEIETIVIAGPGYIKEDFLNYLKTQYENESKTIQLFALNASSGELSAIYEILNSGELTKVVADHRMAEESKYINLFREHMGKDNGLATYGTKEVLNAAQAGAIEELLVLDELIRTLDSKTRSEIEEILERTEDCQGNIHIISSRNPAGEQLKDFGGIIGLLRYRLSWD